MPELPEVQTIVNDLKAAGLEGQCFETARVFWARTIAEPSVKAFCSRIRGQMITAIRRRGKFIVFALQNNTHLLMHLRMSGRLHLVAPDQPRQKHEHVLLNLNGAQQLRFHDTRKFGRLYLMPNADRILGRLGPEPLSKRFTSRKLARLLKPRKRLLKPLLLDQAFIAGLGNIYVDEALWDSKIHPRRIAAALSETEIQALHRAIPRVLKRGLKNLGTSLGTGKTNFYSIAKHQGRNSDQLNVFRRTGQPCPRCQTTIERIIVGQRSTHICPRCQRTDDRAQSSEDE
jgi:formamidopyrimidine-DNA glycosylase